MVSSIDKLWHTSWKKLLCRRIFTRVGIRCFVTTAVLCYRAKDVDFVPYLTTQLIDDFASHIKLYRQALEKLKENQKDSRF